MAAQPHMNNSGPSRDRDRGEDGAEPEASSSQVAHTLTACTRCRQRKTRCDPQLPRCTPCERTNSTCEYYDSARGHNVNRNYVVWLQHAVRNAEEELARTENDDGVEDQEAMMRAATVRMQDAKESKFLGPSSGIAITRLVMQLAKQFTDAASIKEIVPEQRAKQIKELYLQEQEKPTSKVYPLISNVPAITLPSRALVDHLVTMYKLRVQPMYPALHEPTLDRDVDIAFNTPDQASAYQHFVCCMVIAISMQKMDTEYAGLADSYYLAALKHLEPVVRPMDLKTLQCFALMAEYSLLTPTRTAIYYVVGIAVRLAQALGLNEEKTITRGHTDGKVDFLEIDMRRRVFWCVLVMEYGLSHSLGRPAILATGLDHLDVSWFETCDDKYITPDGIDPAAERPTLKKWIAIHFFKMRLLQLEIRRKLYQRKRTTPKDDNDPWFIGMDAKLSAWTDAAPSQEGGHGIDKKWFIGRYNTMIVFLYRPSPQVPRPSLAAAMKCFEACEYNIYMQREQIENKNVDLTWIFTQSLFMAINTMLWSLSYVEVRRKHVREEVSAHLEVAMQCIKKAAERWPGVQSAVQLYTKFIGAIMKIYEKDGDVPISAVSPSDGPSPGSLFQDASIRSRAASPATVSSQSVATPPERQPPFGYINQQSRRSVEEFSPVPLHNRHDSNLSQTPSRPILSGSSSMQHRSSESLPTRSTVNQQQFPQQYSSVGNAQFSSLPAFVPNLTVPGWSAPPQQHTAFTSTVPMESQNLYAHPSFDPNNAAYPFPASYENNANNQQPDPYAPQYWDMDTGDFGSGLDQAQWGELAQKLETDGMEDIQSMISHTLAAMAPKRPPPSTAPSY